MTFVPNKDDQAITVTGAPGSVTSPAKGAEIAVYQVAHVADLAPLANATVAAAIIPGALLATAPVQPDGSFQVAATASPPYLLVLSVVQKADAAGTVIHRSSSGADGAVYDPGQQFARSFGSASNVVIYGVPTSFLITALPTSDSIVSAGLVPIKGIISPGTLSITPAAGASPPSALALDPTGHFFYAATGPDMAISVYSLNSGTATEVQGSPFTQPASGHVPLRIIVWPAGLQLYCIDRAGYIYGYFVQMPSGTLVPIKSATAGSAPVLAAGDGTEFNGAAAVGRDGYGGSLYVIGADATIYNFQVSPNDGTLNRDGAPTLPTGETPVDLAADANGKFLYVMALSGKIYGYVINAPDGTLTPIAGNPLASAASFVNQASPRPATGMMVDKSGAYLLLIDGSSYAIDGASGGLTAAYQAPQVPASELPAAFVEDPANSFIYTASPGDPGGDPAFLAGLSLDLKTGKSTQSSIYSLPNTSAQTALSGLLLISGP